MQDGHGIGKDEVTSSNLVISSTGLAEMQVLFLCFGQKMQDFAPSSFIFLASFVHSPVLVQISVQNQGSK